MTLALQMAERLVAARPQRFDAATVEAAQVCILDLVAVTLSGSVTEAVRRLRAVPGVAAAGSDVLLYGDTRRTSMLDAALVNGTAAHAEDYDDFNEAFGGHPSVPVLPALLALGEARGVSGAALLHAYVCGVEAESRLANAVHFHHYEKGWHPTATLGVFGAAAGCAELLGLDVERTATALAIAASLASGLKANFGSDVKPLHAGHCNRSGLFAALLAEQGFTARDTALEDPQGFLEVFNGAGNYDTARLLEPWFEPPVVRTPGISLKQFPCCGSTHSAIYAALALANTQGVQADDVQHALVEVHPRRLPHTDNPDPRSSLEAKFSIQYCVARALHDGGVKPADFEAAGYGEPAVRALLERIEARPDRSYETHPMGGFAGRVTLRLRDGGERVHEHLLAPGRGGGNAMSEAELKAKFEGCASMVLSSAALEKAWTQLRDFQGLADVRELTATLAAGAGERAAA